MAPRDDLIHQAITAHHRRSDERNQAKVADEQEQAALGVRFVEDYKDRCNEYLGEKLFGASNAPQARRDWFVPDQVREEYELLDGDGERYDQRSFSTRPGRFRVASSIAADAWLTLTVDPHGNPTGMHVNIDGHAPEQVLNLADVGEQIESQRAGQQ